MMTSLDQTSDLWALAKAASHPVMLDTSSGHNKFTLRLPELNGSSVQSFVLSSGSRRKLACSVCMGHPRSDICQNYLLPSQAGALHVRLMAILHAQG